MHFPEKLGISEGTKDLPAAECLYQRTTMGTEYCVKWSPKDILSATQYNLRLPHVLPCTRERGASSMEHVRSVRITFMFFDLANIILHFPRLYALTKYAEQRLRKACQCEDHHNAWSSLPQRATPTQWVHKPWDLNPRVKWSVKYFFLFTMAVWYLQKYPVH